MKTVRICAAVVSCVALLTGCFSPTATALKEEDIHFVQFDEVQPGQEVAVINTSLGKITMTLFPNEAPNTVAYFKKLVNEGFYNDLPLFSQGAEQRVVTGAIDPLAQEGAVETENGKALKCEITPNLWHFSGAVSVLGFEQSRISRQMVSDSRFFMVGEVEPTTDTVKQMEDFNYPEKVIDAYKEYGGLPLYTGSYTVFGQIVDGMDVVNAILSLEVDENGNPTDGTKIISIELAAYEPVSSDVDVSDSDQEPAA